MRIIVFLEKNSKEKKTSFYLMLVAKCKLHRKNIKKYHWKNKTTCQLMRSRSIRLWKMIEGDDDTNNTRTEINFPFLHGHHQGAHKFWHINHEKSIKRADLMRESTTAMVNIVHSQSFETITVKITAWLAIGLPMWSASSLLTYFNHLSFV